MNTPAARAPVDPALVSARGHLAFAAGLDAYVYGLPLVEAMRTAWQMTGVDAPQPSGRAPLNVLGHADRPWTHADRDVVTPANDLLYSMGWLDLSQGPQLLDVPAERTRYWVMALLDAYTNNFVNIGPRRTGGEKRSYALVTEGWNGTLPEGVEAIACPTPLVWLLGRVLVTSDDDLPAARAVQRQMHVRPLAAAPAGPVRHYTDWQPSDDPLAFLDALARGLAANPPPLADAGVVASLGRAGIRPGMPVRAELLEPEVADGLVRGLQAGREVVAAYSRSRHGNAWGINYTLGRFGTDYLGRACTAAKGLGGLSSDEALYAMADYDGARQRLDGRHAYRLRFEAGALPPVDAFWSVSLYGEDFFFVDNPIARHAIGDRTPGLVRMPDGALELLIQHATPPDAQRANWLPAPAGPFYLILRLYHPRDEAVNRSYRIPPVQRVDDAASH